jgi:hypothetical protein
MIRSVRLCYLHTAWPARLEGFVQVGERGAYCISGVPCRVWLHVEFLGAESREVGEESYLPSKI